MRISERLFGAVKDCGSDPLCAAAAPMRHAMKVPREPTIARSHKNHSIRELSGTGRGFTAQ